LFLIAAGAWPAAHAQPPPPEAIPSPIPGGTLDPRSPVKPFDDALREIDRDRLTAPALERYEAGDYDAAAKLGTEVLESVPGQHGLRFAVANSLAWTGRYEPALGHYRQLFGTPYDVRARVGAANVLRWRGQAYLAAPHYLEALAAEPGNKDAADGLAFTGRELRPALTLRGTRAEDNQDLRRDELSLSYRRWSADLGWRFEAGVLGGRLHSPLGVWSPRGFHASAWAAKLPLSPQVEAAYYDSGPRGARLFGSIQVEPLRDRLKLRMGRLDWGRAAFSAAATADGLTARQFGASAEADSGVGTIRGRLDLYDISDDNRVVDGEAQVTPRWQPLPWRLSWFGGVYGRKAEREDPRYWSPQQAYTLAFIGLQRHWSFDRGDLSASVRRGFKLSHSAGNSWSAGASGRIWLRADLALGIEAWTVESPRPGSYRMHHLGAFVQQLL
jgi:tetratricopeptide (TPR) repeat protein